MVTKYTSEAALDFHTGKDEGHLHHAQLANLAAMARSIFHQVGATEVAHPELTTLVNFNGTNGAAPVGRPDRRCPRRPVRHDNMGGTNSAVGTAVRDRQDRQRLRQHPHHPGQLQRHHGAIP